MSRVIAELLNAPEPHFSTLLKKLEAAGGRPGVDIHLSADINAIVQQKIKELGMDTTDTTGRELYHALQALIARHDTFLAQKLGAEDVQDVADILPRIFDCVQQLPIPRSVWAIKHSVAKRLLKSLPPKKVMKHLGYKSIDSMLKREHISEIYSAVRFLESAQWQSKLVKSYRKLQPSDFEVRDIEILLLNAKRWQKATDPYVFTQHHNLSHLKELGVVSLLPMPLKRMRGVTITVLPLLLHYINEVRLYSAFFKLQQVKANFASNIVRTILTDPKDAAIMAGQPLHWRVIQRYFGKGSHTLDPALFEPHVQADDLLWQEAESILYRIEPALQFWEDLDFVGDLDDDQTISFNLMDNAVNYCNSMEYGQQTSMYLQGSLWQELQTRYMGQEVLGAEIVEQLNTKLTNDVALAL